MTYVSEDLLRRHAQSLRALARSLLGDEHAAEDAVQETWIVALERNSAKPDKASNAPLRADKPDEGLGGWLHGVTRRLALQRRRTDGRRAAHERDASECSELDATELSQDVERREVAKLLLDAVLALHEPYQSVVWMRYYENLEPTRIAERTQTPVATVKSRLVRALRLLRQQLDREVEGGRATWTGALAAIEPWRAMPPVTSSPTVSSAVESTVGEALANRIGANMLEWKWILIAGTASLTALTALEWRQATAEPASGPGYAAVQVNKQAIAVLEPGPQAAAEPSAEPQAARQDGRAVVAPEPLIEELSSASPSPFSFSCSGLVVDLNDLPISGATVTAAVFGMPFNDVAETGPDGRFTFNWSGSARRTQLLVEANSAGSHSSGVRSFEVTPERDLQLRLQTGSALFRALEAPEYDSLIRKVKEQTKKDFEARYSRALARPQLGLSEGMFQWPTPAVRELSWQMVRASNTQYKAALVALESAPDPKGWLSLDREVVQLHELLPDEGKSVRILGSVANPPGEAVALAIYSPAAGWRHVGNSAPDGSFEILTQLSKHDAEPGPQSELLVRIGGGDHGLATHSFDLSEWEGETLTFAPLLDRGLVVAGRLVDENGVALDSEDPGERWSIEYVSADGSYSDRTLTRAGHFAIPNLPAGSGQLFVKRPTDEFALLVESHITAGQESVSVALPAEITAPGQLLLSVVDAAGEPAAAELRLVQTKTGLSHTLKLQNADERHESGLPAGTYRVSVGSLEHGFLDLGLIEVQSGASYDLGTVTLPAVASVDWDYDDAVDGVAWRIVRRDTPADAVLGEGLLQGEAPTELLPGSYTLELGAPGFWTPATPFEIRTGAENRVSVKLAEHQQVTLMLGAGPTSLRIDALGESEREIYSGTTLHAGVYLHLAPGLYRLTTLDAEAPTPGTLEPEVLEFEVSGEPVQLP